MYICLCRGITSNQIKEAAQKGVCCNRELNCFLGASPDCGQCGAQTRQIIQQTRATMEYASAEAA
ncbi:MAG: bacterioferritin-associated ferredoxin [Gammaproteobacteria bacterium]|jgi:bacterioferritin-associated ferredoxin|nr:bacterioferritin-associated ferredoxin [Gammaproteobacteria bacterium]